MHSHSVISQCALGTHTRQPSCREGEGRPESCPHGANLGEGDRQPVSSTGEGLLSCKRRTRGARGSASQRPEEARGTTRGAREWRWKPGMGA